MEHRALVTVDPWIHLKAYTRARIALGRVGCSLPTHEMLQFGYAHAKARDAVHAALDVEGLCAQLQAAGFEALPVRSAARDRASFLLRPDLGRRLDAECVKRLRQSTRKGYDVLPIVADGLSSVAVREHALPVLAALRAAFAARWSLGPVVVATQARVALSDHVGELLQARLVVMLIGERPGLSSPDSLGIYITYEPRVGRHDAERNCISNIRPEGMDYDAAARKAGWLVEHALRLGLSGIALKDDADLGQVGAPQRPRSNGEE
jgi:ethanolamine ammonia-lyase small subunit